MGELLQHENRRFRNRHQPSDAVQGMEQEDIALVDTVRLHSNGWQFGGRLQPVGLLARFLPGLLPLLPLGSVADLLRTTRSQEDFTPLFVGPIQSLRDRLLAGHVSLCRVHGVALSAAGVGLVLEKLEESLLLWSHWVHHLLRRRVHVADTKE